jgi:hypothetical protein
VWKRWVVSLDAMSKSKKFLANNFSKSPVGDKQAPVAEEEVLVTEKERI